MLLARGLVCWAPPRTRWTVFPITATARLINASLDTVGIIAGVAAGLTFGEMVGVGIEDFKPGASGLAGAGVTVVGASLAAAGFAFASYDPLRSLIAVGVVGALGQTVDGPASPAARRSARPGGPRRPPSPSVPSATSSPVGSGCPPLVVVVPAIVPLLPGLQIYRGLALLAQGQDGVVRWLPRWGPRWPSRPESSSASTWPAPSSERRADWRPDSRAHAWSASSDDPAPATTSRMPSTIGLKEISRDGAGPHDGAASSPHTDGLGRGSERDLQVGPDVVEVDRPAIRCACLRQLLHPGACHSSGVA